MRPLLDVHMNSEQAYIKIMAHVKRLKMVYASVVKFNVSKSVIKLCNTNKHAYRISDSICYVNIKEFK